MIYSDFKRQTAGSVCRQVLPVVATLAVCVVLATATSAPAKGEYPTIGEPPPAMEWTSVSGETLSWDALREDRPLVMVFWATWCKVCRKDWPKLIELEQKYSEAPVAPAWAAVSLGEDADRVASVAKERELPGWIIADPDEENGRALGIEFVPLVCILDGDGRVAYIGDPKMKDLDRVLKKLTSAKESSP